MNLARIRIQRDSEGVWLWEVMLPSGQLHEFGIENEALDTLRVALDSELQAAEQGLCQLPHLPVVHEDSQSDQEVSHD